MTVQAYYKNYTSVVAEKEFIVEVAADCENDVLQFNWAEGVFLSLTKRYYNDQT